MIDKPVHIAVRKWFDRKNRNTYHSVAVTFDNGQVAVVGCTSGYPDSWVGTVGSIVQNWQGVQPIYDIVNVARKRDLHKGTAR